MPTASPVIETPYRLPEPIVFPSGLTLLSWETPAGKRLRKPYTLSYASSGTSAPAFTSAAMIPYPWLDSTTSGGVFPDRARRRVFSRSLNDRDTRLMVTLGYLAWKAALSFCICSFWPPRTSWSQTVRVTGPSLAMSVLTELAGFGLGLLDPGVQADAATSAVARTMIGFRMAGLLRQPNRRRVRARTAHAVGVMIFLQELPRRRADSSRNGPQTRHHASRTVGSARATVSGAASGM